MALSMRSLLLPFTVLSMSIPAMADVQPARLFSDHMVMQAGVDNPIWGWADAGESVTVSLADQKQTTTADATGKWSVKLRPPTAGDGLTMTLAGKNTVTINDILVGEVWLASGQSNIDFTVMKTKAKSFAGTKDAEAEVKAAEYPKIRMFTVEQNLATEPAADAGGSWKVCSPETVGDFSAVGYFFGRDLHKELNVPVGIITTAWGASTAQCWISRPALDTDPRFGKIMSDFSAALAKFEATKTQPTTQPGGKGPKDPTKDQHNPYLLFNGQVAPLIPYAIRGAIWYQGESIVGGTELYDPLMRTLIADWRKRWGQGDFPFLFVQLAGYKAPATQPAQGGAVARAREAQALTLAVPNTAMATAVDIGDAKNVHPANKQEVGRRLSLAARALAYHQPIEYSGPVYSAMKVEGNQIRLSFSHIGGGLVMKGDKLVGFTIAGEDGKPVFADAVINGETVVVSSPQVTEPMEVSYAWADNPPISLYNKAGLPAPPFRASGKSE